MDQLFKDLKALIVNNWKVLVLISIVVYLIANYTDIKLGVMDAWSEK